MVTLQIVSNTGQLSLAFTLNSYNVLANTSKIAMILI